MLSVFLLTRLAVGLLAWLADSLVPAHAYAFSGEPAPGNPLVNPWGRWDALWYLDVATRGYLDLPDGRSGLVFPPLYPLLVRGLAALFGDPWAAALAVSQAALLGALLLLHGLSRQLTGDAATARRAILYLCLFPSAFVLGAPYTESLFLLLTVGAFAAAERGRWEWASAAALLASATRVVGLLLVPSLLWLAARDRDWRAAGYVLLAPLGLLSFAAWQWSATGVATGFLTGQAGWGRGGDLFTGLASAAEALAHGTWAPGQLGLDLPLDLLALLLGLVGSAAAWRRLGGPYGFYCLLQVLVPVSTGSLMSESRFVLAAFPLFIVLGEQGARPWVDRAVLVAFPSLMAVALSIWAGWYFLL